MPRLSPRTLLPLLCLTAACNEHPLKIVELSRTSERVIDVDIAPLRNVDILFVIDNSGSMAAEQANLAANLAPMIALLEREDVSADYRIAVTTTDVADGACSATGPEDGHFIATSCRSRLEQFQTLPGFVPAEDARQSACMDLCPESLTDLRLLPTSTNAQSEPAPHPWIENILGTTNLPEGVSTEQAFACMGPQGVDGCGVEAPLRAMQRALTRAGAHTEDEFGFLRDDAILLVVVRHRRGRLLGPRRVSIRARRRWFERRVLGRGRAVLHARRQEPWTAFRPTSTSMATSWTARMRCCGRSRSTSRSWRRLQTTSGSKA